MKIAFTGASSTGKTTIANILCESFLYENGLTLLRPKDVREKIRCQVDLLNMEDRLKLQHEIFCEKKLLESSGKDNFLIERSFVDLLAYRKSVEAPLEKNEEYEYINLARQYSIHFYFPHSVVPYQYDGKRPCEDFSKKISQDIKRILDFYKIEYIALDVLDLKERFNIIKEFILSCRNSR